MDLNGSAISSKPPEAPAASPIRLLCVDDNDDDIELIRLALRRADPAQVYRIIAADEQHSFLSGLDQGIDVILCDYNMPRFSPAQAMRLLGERQSDIPVVLVTHAIGEEALVELLRDGAKDYVTKDKLGTLPQVIARVLKDRQRSFDEIRHQGELTVANSRLRELSSRIVAAQERERAAIAHELDDSLAQTLTATVIHLLAARNTSDPAVANDFIDKAADMAKSAVEQLRTLSASLRPPTLDLLGLLPAVHAEVQRLAYPSGLQVKVTTRGANLDAKGDRALVVLRLVQEAVANVVRHAGATRMAVRLRLTNDDRIVLLVADNGIGFDKGAVLDGRGRPKNFGLLGMMERASVIGGRLRLRTQPGSGVIVRAIL